MTDDVFATDNQGGDSALEALVGEGKKFDDVEALAKGKVKSDEHIATLETEMATLKEQLEGAGKGVKMEEVLEAIKNAQAAKEGSTGDKTMSSEDLEKTIKDVLTAVTDDDTKASNRAKGNALVLKKTGGNVEAARALVAERAAGLGMSPAKLAELSESSPLAFAKLIDPDSSTASSGSLSQLDGQNTDALENDTVVLELDGFKTKAWFDAKRKELGHRAYINTPAIQRELARSMNGLRERFNN